MDYNEITAWSTVVLALITLYYAYITHLTFRELNKDRQIVAIEKKLERVYSPFEEAITTLKKDALEYDSSGHHLPPELVESQYYNFDNKIIEVKKNYGHLIDSDIIKDHPNIWGISDHAVYIANDPKAQKEYDIYLDNFFKDVKAKKRKYQNELAKLQGRKSEIEEKGDIK